MLIRLPRPSPRSPTPAASSRRRRPPQGAHGVDAFPRYALVGAVCAVFLVAVGSGGVGVQALTVLSPPRPSTAAVQKSPAATAAAPGAPADRTPSWEDDVWRGASLSTSPELPFLVVKSDEGIEIELPNFARIFDEIRQVSPLARKVMTRTTTAATTPESLPIVGDDDAYQPTRRHPWKLVENSHHRNGPSVRIDKIDNYQGRTASAPLLRFRTTLRGPCLGECFARFIMDHSHRSQWDAQIDQVYEAHSVTQQLSTVQRAMAMANVQLVEEMQTQLGRNDDDAAAFDAAVPDWGTCSKFGVGYCRTKASIVSPREQLTLCGVQDYHDGGCLIWGVEMDRPRHDILMPGNKRGRPLARAKSHLFCTTLSPRAPSSSSMSSSPSFDVEYLLQLEIGGKIPAWISGPVVTENVKQLLTCASHFFAGTDPQRGLETYLLQWAAQAQVQALESMSSPTPSASAMLRPVEAYMEGRHALLMTF